MKKIDKERLAELWRKGFTAPQIARMFGTHPNSVYDCARRLGLPKHPVGRRALFDKEPEKKKWFIRNYPEMGNGTISAFLGISPYHIGRVARKLGLKKSERYWEGIREYHKKRVRQYWNEKMKRDENISKHSD